MERPKDCLLDCIIRKPVFLRVGDVASGTPFKSGCAVIDVLFPGYDTVNVDCMTFQNSYTASIEIKAKTNEQGKDAGWKVCLKRYSLMLQPHYEAGSQDYVTITTDMMCCDTSEVLLLRLILRQPSPHWNSFGVENLKFYMPSSLSSLGSSPSWLNAVDEETPTASKNKDQGLPESDGVADLMQQMWAMTQELKTVSKSDKPIGRFEVDGSYDVNLLSYT